MVNARQSTNSISTPFPQLIGLQSPSSDDRLPESEEQVVMINIMPFNGTLAKATLD